MTNLFSSFSLFYNLLFFFNFFSFFSNWGTEVLQKYEYHHIGSALILFGKFLRGRKGGHLIFVYIWCCSLEIKNQTYKKKNRLKKYN